MSYTNLLYFLVVIFALTTDNAPDHPALPPLFALSLLVLVYGAYSYLCRKVFAQGGGSRTYFARERFLSVTAVAVFVASLHGLDLKYYLHPLALGGRLPVLENLGGLGLFFGYLSLMWIHARKPYQEVFQRSHTHLSFIAANIRANLPIVLPWLLITLLFDLLALLSIPGLQQLLDSPWGDVALFAVFVLFLLFFFPPLVRLLWRCMPLPAGPLRTRMEQFCQNQGFSAEILLWPLFEGQVLTAGVMGIIPRLRYLLVTPALLKALTWDELSAVLAHEIGHVKKKHLVLYIFLILGFSLFAGAVAKPLPFFILDSEWFYQLIGWLEVSPETVLAILLALPVLVLMILYFRYLFGYFIRNFERQADLHVFSVLGDSRALISSFEKIAVLGGNIREQKSWHHFGIGERIDFLHACERDQGAIRRHDRKVWISLLVYFVMVAGIAGGLGRSDFREIPVNAEIRYIEAMLAHKVQQGTADGLLFLLLGDLLQEKKMEARAIAAYEAALRLKPENPDIYNNLAWLLATAQDPSLRDPARAVALARKAVGLKKSGYILDTLAVALWQNGSFEAALAAERRALEIDPDNAEYYRGQLRKMGQEAGGKGEP
ncbi:MAG TPA: peptidase M48 Ste24p [Desulfobulbaceae bacterium]|nr:peptidase M48 Ste24p [Desulfobulbaceae bacterium]